MLFRYFSTQCWWKKHESGGHCAKEHARNTTSATSLDASRPHKSHLPLISCSLDVPITSCCSFAPLPPILLPRDADLGLTFYDPATRPNNHSNVTLSTNARKLKKQKQRNKVGGHFHVSKSYAVPEMEPGTLRSSSTMGSRIRAFSSSCP
jgi:hypothetical protein